MEARDARSRPWFSYGLEWAATACSIVGAVMLVMHRGGPAFGFFLAGSGCWIVFGAYHKYWGLVGCQTVFFVIDVIGIVKVVMGTWG